MRAPRSEAGFVWAPPKDSRSIILGPGAHRGILFDKKGIKSATLQHTQGDMTAIISAYTSGGFVIGADGRSLHEGRIACEHSQKLFNFKRRGINVTYAWCGTTHVTNERGETIFDLNVITKTALSAAALAARDEFFVFVERCRSGIYDGICQSPVVKRITNHDVLANDSRARMLLNGYFYGTPFTAEFYIWEKDKIKVTADEIHFPIPLPTRNFFSGCGEQNKKFFDVLPTTTPEALQLVSDYIQGCIDSTKPDCFSMGGHKHIAYLGMDGFSWVVEPAKFR